MSEYRHWRYEQDEDDLVWLTYDLADATTNVLNAEGLSEFVGILDDIRALAPRAVIIQSGKHNGFIAGADIKSFTPMESRTQGFELIKRGQSAFDHLEGMPFTTVCLIKGFCLGGGMELALACDYRIACDDDKTRLGLPEVKLGIHPGFGGSARLVQLIGGLPAMDAMLTGRAYRARAAYKMGMVDYAVPERQLIPAARATALNPPRRKPIKWWNKLSNHSLVRPLLARILRSKVAAKAHPDHYPAPYALIDLWVKHGDNKHAMLDAEAESVADLIVGDTAQNLVRVFFLQERMKSLGKDSTFKAKHVHVIGAGVMGGDIAAWCASRGLTVTLQDKSPERIAPAIGRAYKMFQKRIKDRRQITAAMDRLIPDVGGRFVERADVVIEAIFEDANVKRALYREIEPRLKPTAILATNTSSIPLQELSESLVKPERLVGLHFFNPVAMMQLVEIVHSPETDDQVVADAMAFTRQIDRLPLPVASKPGFLVNRVLMPYLLEAVELVDEGVPATAIDKAAKTFGMPMGPIELADTVGLDICLHVADILGAQLGMAVPARLKQMVDAGKLGRKSGEGFYRYPKGKPVKPKTGGDHAVPDDLIDRMIMRYINEAVACLRDEVITDPDLLDAGMIFGTGFAPFRGGPMHYVSDEGIDDMLVRLHDLTSRHGERFTPDAGWNSLKSTMVEHDAA